MNMYEAVKESVTARQAAEVYGLEINQHGMCRCPFHNDKNPSMKVDKRYHCFGCGADGDVINLVANLFSLSNFEATKKLVHDFNVTGYEKWHDPSEIEIRRKQWLLQKKKMQERQTTIFYNYYCDYFQILRQDIINYSPKHPDDPIDSRYAEAVKKYPFIEYILDTFSQLDSLEEKMSMVDFYKDTTEEVKKALNIRKIKEQQTAIFKKNKNKENYLKNAEEYLEDDYDMIDGMINNGIKAPVLDDIRKDSYKKESVIEI